MKKKLTIAAVASGLVLALAGCGAASTVSAPLPQEKSAAAPAAKAPAAKAPVAKPAAAPVAKAPAAKPAAAPVAEAPPAEEPADAEPAASTCDVVREALLTGTPAKITSSMKALIADKTAPATAREYARYYTVRDKGQKDMQSMDESLISMACTL